MKKILIPGGSPTDIPLIETAKRLGLYVITTGKMSEALGHRHGHEYQYCDYSDKEAIAELAAKLRVDAVCPGADDAATLSCAWTAEKLGLPGFDSYETMLTLLHKDKFHIFAREHNVPIAETRIFSSAEEALAQADSLKFPAILKPVDMSAGRGVSRVESVEELRAAVSFAQGSSRTPRFLVQEFLEPDSYHHNYVGFVARGEVAWGCSDNEHHYLNPYQVWGMSTPSTESEAVHEELRGILNRIIGQLNLKPGVLWVQHCVVKGELKLLEVARRVPGTLHGRMLELATGFPVCEWAIRTALGDDCSAIRQIDGKGFWGEHCIMAPHNGRVKEVRYEGGIESAIRESYIFGGAGTEITNYKMDKLGMLLLEFSSMEEMLDKSDRMYEYVRVIMEDE